MFLSTGGVDYISLSLLQLSATILGLQVCEAHHAPSYYRSPSATDVLLRANFELFQRQSLVSFVMQ